MLSYRTYALALVWTHTPAGGAKRAIDSEDDDSEIKSQPIKPPKKKGKVLGQ